MSVKDALLVALKSYIGNGRTLTYNEGKELPTMMRLEKYLRQMPSLEVDPENETVA
jgi:hypothetical protein